jgi:uncharacterized membrane protein
VPNDLVHVGFTLLCVGMLATVVGAGWVTTPRAQLFACWMGLAWAGAISAMAYAVSSLGVPVSIIAPLTNSNASVALTVSALAFREWADLNGPRALAGAPLIVSGAMVAATAKC